MGMSKLKLSWLETFFVTFQAKSYTRAAAIIECSPANVKKHIGHMEEVLGKQLFIKKNKALVPTADAKHLFNKTYNHFENLERECSAIDNSPSDETLKIVTSTGASMFWTIDAISEMSKSIENASVFVHTSESETLDLSEEFDILAWPQPVNDPKYKLIKKIPLFTKLFASEAYLNQMGEVKTSQDLDNHKLISFYRSQTSYRGDSDWPLREGRKQSSPRVPSVIVDNANGIAKAIINGLGIGVLTTNSPYTAFPGVVPVLPDIYHESGDIYLLHNIDASNKPGVNYFIKHFS